jgi:hypothetical protein
MKPNDTLALYRVFKRLVALSTAMSVLESYSDIVAFAGTEQTNLAKVPPGYAKVQELHWQERFRIFWAVLLLALRHVHSCQPTFGKAFSRAAQNVSDGFWQLVHGNEFLVTEADRRVRLAMLLRDLVSASHRVIPSDRQLIECVRKSLRYSGRSGWVEDLALSVLETAPQQGLGWMDLLDRPIATLFLNTDEVFAGFLRDELRVEDLDNAFFFAPRTYWTEHTMASVKLATERPALYQKVVSAMISAESNNRLLIVESRDHARINFWLEMWGFSPASEALATYDPRNAGYARFRELRTGLRPMLYSDPNWQHYCQSVEVAAERAESLARNARLQV